MRDVTIPALGMAMTEALLLTWLKEPGDAVVEGEPIAEIETDKATMDLESPATGVLGRHLFDAGVLVPIASPVCRILEAGEVVRNKGGIDVASPHQGFTSGGQTTNNMLPGIQREPVCLFS